MTADAPSTLPDAFTARMRALLGAEAEVFFAALQAPHRTGLRVNPLKLNPAAFRDLAPWSLEPLPWTASGFVAATEDAGKHPYHAMGLYYLQEPSAMAVAEAVAPQKDELVLDLAAAPGGKTTHLVGLMGDGGVVVANEVRRGRAGALLENLERWGARRAMVTNESVARLAHTWGAVFDRVLLDAPCSGEGMFGKSEAALEMWSEANVLGCAKRQTDLLAEAAALVKGGGSLAYSTCTFAPEENEAVIAQFLAEHSDFELEPLTLPGLSPGRPDWLPKGLENKAVAQTARLWPHRGVGEGHFIALLRKARGEENALKPTNFRAVPPQVTKLWQAFAEDLLPDTGLADTKLTLFGNRLFAVPERMPEVRGLNVLRTGLGLATLHRNRLEPLHSLALTLSRDDAAKMNRLELAPGDPRLELYLRGHPLEAEGEKGWTLITVAGFPLGWGKRSGRTVKNAYPKGLRRG